MDLTATYPRSVSEKLAGVVMLARTTDKAKAKAHGNLGEYHYDCPMDKAVFGFLGIDQAQYLEAVAHARSDADIENYAKQFVQKKTAAEIDTFNANFLQYKPEAGSEAETDFHELRKSVAPDRDDVTTWADVLDLDEKRVVPRRTAAAL